MNAFYTKGIQGFVEADIDFTADNIKLVLIDFADYASAKPITGATNATPIVITATSHGFSNGDIVTISGVGGNTAANGVFRIANQATNTFELTHRDTGANIAGSGAYTSGGWAVRINVDDNLDDIAAAARVATSANLTSKTATDGVLDAADVTLSAVTGDPSEGIVLYKDTGTASTSRLIALIDTATGLPITPNGGDISISWDNGNLKIGRP